MGGPGGTVERCTVILTPRDLFSVTEECLRHLFRNTPEPFDLIIVLGGAPADLRSRWKWDITAVMESYRYMQEKWQIDVGGPRADFKRYLVGVNARVGALTQLYPSRATIFVDRLVRYLGERMLSLASVRRRFTAWRVGYYRESP